MEKAMSQTAVHPERITRPIQLLGAWLAGLLSIDACFLIAASRFAGGSWESQVLVIAAIANVPLFLLAVFLLQTKFRPEMQEDSFYSTYLSRRTNEPVVVTKDDAQFSQVLQKIAVLEGTLAASWAQVASAEPATTPRRIAELSVGVNSSLPDYPDIKNRIGTFGILGYSIFGTGEAPEERVVAISRYLDKSTQRNILSIAKELGFSHYSIFDNVSEDTEEDVLFGAYGGDARHIAGGA